MMQFLAGILLLALSLATLWLLRARDGEVISLLKSEFAQFAISLAFMVAVFGAIALMAVGATSR
jgi:hypothetical protein